MIRSSSSLFFVFVLLTGCGSTGSSSLSEFKSLERTASAVLISNACPPTEDSNRTVSQYGADLIPDRGRHVVEVNASTRVLCGTGVIHGVRPRINSGR